MWGKKKRDSASFCTVDTQKEIKTDFGLRSSHHGFESYRTVDYIKFYELSHDAYYGAIDEHLDRLFKGEIDDANGNVLERFTFGPVRKAFPDLKIQHIDRQDTIRRFIVRNASDLNDLKAIREARQSELNDLESELSSVINKISDIGGAV